MEEAGAPREHSAPQPAADLTPDAVRTHGQTLPHSVRGYDASAVDALLDRIADRLEELEHHDRGLTDRVNELAKKVFFHESRAWAVQEALVTAQTLRVETQAKATAAADDLRTQASREAESLLRAARTEHARLEDEVRAVRDEAAEHARRVREDAAAEAASILERAEEWAAQETRRIEAESGATGEEALRKADEARKVAAKEARSTRDKARRETNKLRTEATELRDRAETDAKLIREEVKTEVELLRQRVATEVDSLRDLAAADATQMREDAERDAREIEERTRIDLERASAKVQVQIEERHGILERLEERRMMFLVDFRSLLHREMEAVEAERDRDGSADRSTDQPDDAAVVQADTDEADSTAESEPLPVDVPSIPEKEPHSPGVAVGWSSMINPETGAVIDGDGLIPRGPRAAEEPPGPVDPGLEGPSVDGELHATEAQPPDETDETNGEASP